MKFKLKLPGDYTGGFMIFGIMFTIEIIELYILKKTVDAGQAKGLGLTPGFGVGGGGALGGAGFGTAGTQLINCEELHKGNKKKIEKCKDAIRKARPSGGGGITSMQQKQILTQATQ